LDGNIWNLLKRKFINHYLLVFQNFKFVEFFNNNGYDYKRFQNYLDPRNEHHFNEKKEETTVLELLI
jgi:hypothetical protein